MSATYTPRAGSVAYKVIQLLAANPDEQLDAGLIAAKCDCDRRNVHTLLGPAVQACMLMRTEDMESGELVYSAGAAIPVSGGQPPGRGFHGWLERKGQASAEGRAPRQAAPLATTAPEKKRSAPFWIDASTVRIDKGVPIPGRGTKAIDWAPLLGQLAVGDSFLLPATAKSAIGNAMKAFKDSTGKTLASRKVDGGIRVWRIE